jgi:F-type H+-transporting ATPase subunit b
VFFTTPTFAQEEPHGAAEGAAEGTVAHESAEAHGGEHHGGFPPFDPATFGSQLFWLAICFGALYLLMSRVALPRVGGILNERSNRVAADLAEAGRLKEETDAAIAAYEQGLAEARQNAHAIGQKGRDAAKAEIDADRRRIEADLQTKLSAAEARVGDVKTRALAEVDAIARDATEAIVETLVGRGIGKAEIAQAVAAAQERG